MFEHPQSIAVTRAIFSASTAALMIPTWSCRLWRYKLHKVSNIAISRREFGRTKKVHDTARVTPLVVIPSYKLHKVVIESDTSLGVKDRRVGVSIQVRGNDVILGV